MLIERKYWKQIVSSIALISLEHLQQKKVPSNWAKAHLEMMTVL